ncbi:hypothetical protein OF829_00815 [Sphingomonas sp. LB-2]|uniref:hypothetical protein n=1 Tax=Sphingomonas caeni TaxID=2984949 RepID=UPI00222EBCC6|nr:hypothetical protein [Sphingomonas caeni]MCW3845762.1 hypothetical protein [Sphingomonas caeni]
MAFREKMLWASMAATLGIWGWYFIRFARALKAGNFDQGAATGDFVMTVALVVGVHIVAAIILAVITGKEAGAPADDREKAFALSAYRPAYFTLSSAVVTLMLAGPVLLRIANEWQPAPPHGLAPVLLGNALLASLVLAELVHSGWQIARFRMGG